MPERLKKLFAALYPTYVKHCEGLEPVVYSIAKRFHAIVHLYITYCNKDMTYIYVLELPPRLLFDSGVY